MTADEALLLDVLDQIEQREARLLTWGLVDGYLAKNEIEDIFDQLIDNQTFHEEGNSDPLGIYSAEEVISRLRARALLLEVGGPGEGHYRSRMAETVRLLFRLRQLFPKHKGPTGWHAAPTLVADFRFIWRRRRYPNRCIEPDEAVKQIVASDGSANLRQAVGELVRAHGGGFRFARFQVEAAKRILSGLESKRSQATLVSAGTGSGKTLAFYLPALSRAAYHICRDAIGSRRVKILALYPRNELLKDQFAEVYAEARRLDSWLNSQGRRKLVIGTFFGPTPTNAAMVQAKKWRRKDNGVVCEYFRCPTPECAGDMVWADSDSENGVERLTCTECGARAESDEIILTRERLEREPPDILFTTTEMLNRRMGDNRYRHLFGIGRGQPVEMMLLDEVHTYTSSTGAQVAYLLRRWRHLHRAPVSFVGLSATLKDGARFFARMTGVAEHSSAEIKPASRELITEGAEYLLALRGDPVSRAALLSTTIQTAMLLIRMLDQPGSGKSQGILGERLFLFTDNIDVTNRAYFAMLDGEGRNSFGNIDAKRQEGGLAALRFPMPNALRKMHGQDWEAAIEVGHSLNKNDRKSVGRVMAMDPGVAAGLDIIVATAALEVGFNDPQVGAVIQHKAPRDIAQFLQRKGRAGRSRSMRPWTVVVLSDYGRDRVAYQAYDLLFDPELLVRTLPLGNRYVERIQAVYATMDYLSQHLRQAANGSVWTNLAGPTSSSHQRRRQKALARLIEGILTNPEDRRDYASFLAKALAIPEAEIDQLLWEHPRPLLMEVLPAARRRLETGWGDLRVGKQTEEHGRNSPLPEFAPPNLFSDLNLPEVGIVVPPAGRASTPETVMMPILQAMREYAPGRVSRRYGIQHQYQRHWLCPKLDDSGIQTFPLQNIGEVDFLGEWQTGEAGVSLPVFRPRLFNVQVSPKAVLDTSNARLRWCSQIVVPADGGLILEPPQGAPWSDIVSRIRFFTHQGLSSVEVRRMAPGSDADIRYKDGTSQNKRIDFQNDGESAALGFSLSVDAFCISLRIPNPLWSTLGEGPAQRALRTARFHDEVINGPGLPSIPNPFAREWLSYLLLATLSNEAIAKDISLREAAGNLAAGTANLTLEQTLDILFQSAVIDDPDAQANEQDRLRQDLAGFIADDAVKSELLQLASTLWLPVTADWEAWLRRRFAVTTAAAAFQAVLALCPELDAQSLLVDVRPSQEDGHDAEIWISEGAPGGNGQIEEVLRQYAEDPRRYFSLMSAALRDNDFALTDYQLCRFLEITTEADPGGDIAEATRNFRQADGLRATEESFSYLRETLAADGFVNFHGFIVALTNRVLRPGSNTQSDSFILEAVRMWKSEEERLGIELDSRVIAYRLSRRPNIDSALNFAGVQTPDVNPDQWRMGVVYGLLWPRGAQIRQSGLRLYSPFVDLPAPEPLLVNGFLQDSQEVIELSDDEWKANCFASLARRGAALLACDAAESSRMAEALNFLATNPVQSSYLSVFARIQAVRREGSRIIAHADIPEALQ